MTAYRNNVYDAQNKLQGSEIVDVANIDAAGVWGRDYMDLCRARNPGGGLVGWKVLTEPIDPEVWGELAHVIDDVQLLNVVRTRRRSR